MSLIHVRTPKVLALLLSKLLRNARMLASALTGEARLMESVVRFFLFILLLHSDELSP